MDDSYQKSGVSFKGVDKETFDRAKQLTQVYTEQANILKQQGSFLSAISGQFGNQRDIAQAVKDTLAGNRDLTEEQVKSFTELTGKGAKVAGAVQNIAPGMVSFAQGAQSTVGSFVTMLGPIGLIVGALMIVGKLVLGFAKDIADVRKDLGVSATTAAEVAIQTKAIGFAAKAYGLDVEDIKSAQTAIRNDLGASVQESVKLSLSFARTSAATGQTADELSTTLSLMESISSASRDVLLNQIRANAAMIEAQGVAPSLVMKDIASNAEFFAQYAKDGGMNLINAGVAARKLGLNMSAVASISDSLLDFESSIEKQMEASMLLGRQINLDKARQLAFTGDQEGMMKEILRQVGGETEFAKMNVIQRKALADSVGVNVEQLSRLVRNNQAAATGGAVGGAVSKTMGDYSKVSAENSGKTVDVLTEALNVSKKQLSEMTN
jgi:hypothetical protein